MYGGKGLVVACMWYRLEGRGDEGESEEKVGGAEEL